MPDAPALDPDTLEVRARHTLPKAADSVTSAVFRDGRLVALPIVGLPLVRQWFLLNRRDRQLTSAARIFRDFVSEGRDEFFPRIGPNDFRA